ncbi:MAG: type II secretion system minor pseudopilin GspK [Pseudomonadota bacterium]
MTVRSQTDGFVLVNALILVAAMAAAAILLLSRAEGGQTRLVAMQQAEMLIGGLDTYEALARAVLDRDLLAGGLDGPGDIWAEPITDAPLAHGSVSGQITDQQALFNINWLADPEDTFALESGRRLFQRIGLSPQKADAIIAYVSPVGPGNRATYAALRPPVSPLGGSLLMLDQLAALPELQPRDFALLRQHTTALPGRSPVNVNTADAGLLSAVLPQLSAARIDAALMRRRSERFPSTEAFFRDLGLLVDPQVPGAVDISRFSVGSNWFRADIVARLDDREARRQVLLRREGTVRGTQVEWRVSRFEPVP